MELVADNKNPKDSIRRLRDAANELDRLSWHEPENFAAMWKEVEDAEIALRQIEEQRKDG